jgi:polyferredoxin
MSKPALQRYRVYAQIGFFALFTLTPIFDLFRYDLTEKHAYFLTFQWHLGIDDLIAGRVNPATAGVNLILYLFLPLLGTLALIIGVAWKWGRLYCGWLCPHFSVVETINRLMLFATGKHSLWDKNKTPPWEPDGTPAPRDPRYWLAVVPAAIGFAFAWAVVLLTYLMPPFHVYHGLLNFSLYRGEVIFLCAATTVLTLEFLFARHLFCRYGCAIGIFQSFAWIVNKKAMVVGFERQRLSECANCMQGCGSAGNTTLARHERHASASSEVAAPAGSACDAACPMRLKPRNVKRWMFACTQCGQCVSACGTVNRDNPNGQLLRWVSNEAAKQNEAGFSALSRVDEDAGARQV